MEPLNYKDFRTGLSFAEVYYMIWSRKWKRRKGVLGKWRQIKQAMYQHYLEEFYGHNSRANEGQCQKNRNTHGRLAKNKSQRVQALPKM